MNSTIYDLIRRPRLTEKSARLQEQALLHRFRSVDHFRLSCHMQQECQRTLPIL